MKYGSFALLAGLLLSGCSSTYIKVENPDVLRPDKEFERAVTIEVPDAEPGTEAASVATAPPETKKEESPSAKPPKTTAPKKTAKKTPVATAAKTATKGKKTTAPARREPDLEDDKGFQGRRTVKDPFWVGETVVHDVSYFKVSAGSLTMRVDPFAQVNGKKAYNLATHIKTYDTFSKLVYAVDDKVVALMDFEQMIPRVFTMHVKESNQAREVRSFFDFDKMEANFWEKKVTKKNGVEEKKMKWEILPYSQNVFSAAFYMRLFAWEDGKEYAFRVADDGENLVFKGKTLRREVLDTEIGPIKAVVVKPEITLKGNFKPIGDILIWLSDDDRKHILRIESKIKIGTLVSEIVELKPGKAP
ncbi:MAG TPA: DUF3108 domain-containing protein [Pseudobdellovibrionaceae bacterium]|nr:DUF3108 domain-containing protein [Pseudobdellovibrionaceae bacterium]